MHLSFACMSNHCRKQFHIHARSPCIGTHVFHREVFALRVCREALRKYFREVAMILTEQESADDGVLVSHLRAPFLTDWQQVGTNFSNNMTCAKNTETQNVDVHAYLYMHATPVQFTVRKQAEANLIFGFAFKMQA